ncbi:MAG: recombinase family protein [Clostridia bacterium]|nr:recombinase family protein [Clostridia bacterium]
MAKTITAFPATKNIFTTAAIASTARRKVAGYARVSTDSDEQFTSYEAQVDYYTQFIHSHPDWVFVKVYTDEGISAVSTKHRDGFNEMVEDALAGRIDLIVTKSVSRFARNTVDSLTTIRKLKDHGVECFFEKENIWTFDGKGELLITIMSSLAQEESRSISENVTWSHRKRMADGKVSLAYSTFLGYDRGEDGALVVNPEQAAIVRLIYRSFLDGMTPALVCRMLEERRILSPGGKKKWCPSTVVSILTNEKYKGDALLQKTFTVDFLTKKHKVNEGEVPQFYVHGNHDAIVTPLEFEKVQAELARRKSIGRGYSGSSIFASRLVCGDCGAFYGQKVWHSTDKYRKLIWRCNRKYGNGEKCRTPTLTEEAIKALFLKAYNLLMADRESIAEDCRVMAGLLSDTTALDEKIDTTQKEIDKVVALNNSHIRTFAATGAGRELFEQQAAEYDSRFKKAEARLEKLKAARDEHLSRSRVIEGFIEDMLNAPLVLTEWQDQLWNMLVRQAVISADGTAVFTFKGEKTITVRME